MWNKCPIGDWRPIDPADLSQVGGLGQLIQAGVS